MKNVEVLTRERDATLQLFLNTTGVLQRLHEKRWKSLRYCVREFESCNEVLQKVAQVMLQRLIFYSVLEVGGMQ